MIWNPAILKKVFVLYSSVPDYLPVEIKLMPLKDYNAISKCHIGLELIFNKDVL